MAKCLPVLLVQDLCTHCLPCLVHSASLSCSANTFPRRPLHSQSSSLVSHYAPIASPLSSLTSSQLTSALAPLRM